MAQGAIQSRGPTFSKVSVRRSWPASEKDDFQIPEDQAAILGDEDVAGLMSR